MEARPDPRGWDTLAMPVEPPKAQRQPTLGLVARRVTLGAGLVTGGLVFTVVALLQCFVASPTLLQLAELRSSQRTTLATATTTDPGAHESCTFRYTVRGHVYNHGEAVCAVTGVGDTFSITYDPDNPLIVESMGESARSAFLTNVVFLVLAFVVFGFVTTAGLRQIWRRLQAEE